MKDDIICTNKYSLRLQRWKLWNISTENWSALFPENPILQAAEVEIKRDVER
jgi:hypothetical protein